MIARFSLAVSVLLLVVCGSRLHGSAENAMFFTCDFLEKYNDSGWQVVDSRSFAAELGRDFQFSMANFSYRLQPSGIDKQTVRLQSQVNCLDMKQRNFFDDKLVGRGASVFFDSALVRGESLFRIRLTFDSLGAKTGDCRYLFSDTSFHYDPSGKYDFYYIKHSLGDHHWNEIRDAFEYDYKRSAPMFDLQDQSKINFYICPCQVPDVGWDWRWDNAIDLSRNNVFAHFTHGINALHSQSVLALRLVRNWGYAPALLVEGAASAPEFCDLFAKEFRNDKRLPILEELGISRDFRAIDPHIATVSAGSFVGYLLRWRGVASFRDFYQHATDLSLAAAFESAYGQPLNVVENHWHDYLDTVTIAPATYGYYISRAQAFMKVADIALYAEKALNTFADTSRFGATLANVYYTAGDYSRAERFFGFLAKRDTADVNAEVYLANMLLAQGKTDEADSLYRLVIKADTANYYASQKVGLIEFYRRNYSRAVQHIREAMAKNKVAANGIDLSLALGDVYAAMGIPDSSRKYFQSALDNAKLLMGSFADNPLHALRAGKAALRLGSPKAALEYLDAAFFLEERMFYIGQILLAMGQAHDLLGEREAASADYHMVLKEPTAYFDRQEAELCLKTPYRN